MKSIYPFIQGKQPQISKRIIFDADKNCATCGRIQRDERWWWSTWKEECHLLLTKWNHFIPSSRESNRKSANASFLMRTKTVQPAVAFNATKDDDDLLEKKSVIFCWLNEITSSLHPGKATANQQTHHFWCGQKLSNLRSHSTRRKMIMIYLKRRVSSFADSLKSLYAISSRGLQDDINGFLNCFKKVFSSCRIHLRTAIPDRELQHPCLCHLTKPIQIRIHIRSNSSPVWLQSYDTKPQYHSHAKCKWCYNMGRDWVVLIRKLWMNLTKHTLHTHAFGQKSIGFFVRLNF